MFQGKTKIKLSQKTGSIPLNKKQDVTDQTENRLFLVKI
jgi:hypothetical protein